MPYLRCNWHHQSQKSHASGGGKMLVLWQCSQLSIAHETNLFENGWIAHYLHAERLTLAQIAGVQKEVADNVFLK